MKRLFYILAFFFLACTSNRHPINIVPGTTVFFNEDELLNLKIKTSEFIIDTVCRTKDLIGKLNVIPINNYYVNLPIAGFVKTIYVHKGETVKKHQTLAVIEHERYLDLKRDFLKAKVNFDYQKDKYQRQGELAIEQATSLKKMEEAKYDYNTAEAEYNSLSAKLLLIGINSGELTPENINTEAYLKSPVSGKIVGNSAEKGRYYTNSNNLFVIADSLSERIVFKIKRQDAYKICNQKPVEIELGPKIFQGNITAIEKIENNCDFVSIVVKIPSGISIENKSNISGKVLLSDTVLSIPKTAIIGNKYIVVEKNKSQFMACVIHILSSSGDVVQIENDYKIMNLSFVENPDKKLISRFINQ